MSEDMKTQKDARLCLVAECDKAGNNGTTQATLFHPDSELENVIYTDASARAIGGVLMQKDKEENLSIIFTTSRVLNPTEQRYTACEQ